MRLAYNGSSYHGWQIQPSAKTIQQTVESALSTILRQEITVVGAGRTDTGVHAAEMYAHFDFQGELSDIDSLLNSLNKLIGEDIVIFRIFPVADDNHARFDASLRTYKYFVSYKKSPFLYPFCMRIYRPLDIDEMNRGADFLLSQDDFTSFAKLHSDSKTNICKIKSALWTREKREISVLNNSLPFDGIVFTISADRFLRNMVRAIVGTLIDLGKGKISFDDFKQIIDCKNRCNAGESVPAKGLFLWKIEYPFINN